MFGYQQSYYQQPQQTGILWVQGEAGAKSYPVAPGASVQLMDSEDSVFYIKTADQSGMPNLRKFRFEEVTQRQAQEAPRDDLSKYVTRDELKDILEEMGVATPKEGKK